ncbi:hypothetical protein [Sphingobacterium bambusae]|uniref:Auto-transporter adhesin head GIN domain-containing protein n=1 Tax=Sphingobacterium bambusae TaxID=662858 RepID=A0ABW6BLA8_9SPHI|nr:hypothetical protein [Sphingobacterium bambusae]WPL48196.1 hypothetical protein SCB77_19770 [Sphingobacterium bambusae]
MMKTSSKLLIILGITLFVVPIAIMSFTVMENRVDVVDYQKDMDREATSLEGEDVYLQTTPLKAFDKVRLLGEGRRGPISLIIVKSDKHALKLEKNREVKLKFEVDDKGTLIIHGEESAEYYFNTVYLFTPNVHNLELKDVDVQTKIETDSLTVQGDNLSGFQLSSGTKIDDLYLNLKKSKIAMNTDNREENVNYSVRRLSLDVDSSEVNLGPHDLKKLSLLAKNSKVSFPSKGKRWMLDELSLITEGKSSITLDSLQSKTLSGNLSDQTTIDLPVQQLRQIISRN